MQLNGRKCSAIDIRSAGASSLGFPNWDVAPVAPGGHIVHAARRFGAHCRGKTLDRREKASLRCPRVRRMCIFAVLLALWECALGKNYEAEQECFLAFPNNGIYLGKLTPDNFSQMLMNSSCLASFSAAFFGLSAPCGVK